MKAAIESECPEVTVIENTEHPSIMSIISQPTARTPFPKLSFPKTGSFEVYFRGKIIFSKLKLGIWPHPAMVSKNIREILDGYEEPKTAPANKFREKLITNESPTKIETKSLSNFKKEPSYQASPNLEDNFPPKPVEEKKPDMEKHIEHVKPAEQIKPEIQKSVEQIKPEIQRPLEDKPEPIKAHIIKEPAKQEISSHIEKKEEIIKHVEEIKPINEEKLEKNVYLNLK